jgi:hypothetical protein
VRPLARMVALGAAMNKLLLWVFALLHHERDWDPAHEWQPTRKTCYEESSGEHGDDVTICYEESSGEHGDDVTILATRTSAIGDDCAR